MELHVHVVRCTGRVKLGHGMFLIQMFYQDFSFLPSVLPYPFSLSLPSVICIVEVK